jgi:mycothiol synthase
MNTQERRVNADEPIRSRAYVPDADRARLEQFIYATTPQGSPYTFGHIGNLSWSMFFNTRIDPARGARLWEDDGGTLLGLGWLDCGELVMHVDPALRGRGVLEQRMLAWAEAQTRADNAGASAELTTSVDADDAAYAALLEQHGFVRGENASVLLECDLLALPLPDITPPHGAIVRPVGGPDEYEERVNAHRDAFEPSGFTVEAYRNVRAAPGYDPDLDLVAVLPDGTFASYCICWWDGVNQRGLFEPVGTRRAWQRQGFGRAVMLEGLRRLRARGATSAAVGTGANHVEGVRLYENVGMRVVKRDDRYSKMLI